MSKITLTKTVTRTYNLGDYENYKPTISITKEYDEKDIINIEDELNKMTTILDNELKKEKEKLKK